MPVRKFRGVEEIEEGLWREPNDPALWRAIAAVWTFAERTVPRRFPPGVYRHRSIADAERLREEWQERDFQALWRRRGVDPERLSGNGPPRPGER